MRAIFLTAVLGLSGLAGFIGPVHADTFTAEATAAAEPAATPAAAPAPVLKDAPSVEFQVLVARYPNWSRLSGCPADKIQYDFMTHILYAGFVTNSRGAIVNSDPSDEANFKALIGLAHAKGVRVLLSIAGKPQPGGFKSMAASPASRARFIKNCLLAVEAYKVDGIDLVWKYPIAGDGDNQLRLHREMRSAIDRHPRKILFTAEVPARDKWARHSTDESLVIPDFLFVMSFDYFQEKDKRAIPNAGAGMVKSSLEYYERRGVPKNKLVLGTPFYGRSFEGASTLGASSVGKGSGNDGIWPWKDLLPRFKAMDYRIYWDEATESEYAVGNGEIISFNGLATQHARARFARSNGYAGLAAWDLPNDTAGRDQSLLVALHQDLLGESKVPVSKPPSGPKWESPTE